MPETEEFPPDEFDEVPADAAHRGLYRAASPAPAVGRRTTAGIVLAGVLALILGALMFVYQPRTAAPDAGAAPGGSPAAQMSGRGVFALSPGECQDWV